MSLVSLLYGVFLPISVDYSITTVKSCLHYFSEEIDWRDCISLNKYGNAGKKMNYQNDDLRIKEINELLPPVALWKNSLLPKMLQTPLHMLAKRFIRSSKATMTVCWW